LARDIPNSAKPQRSPDLDLVIKLLIERGMDLEKASHVAPILVEYEHRSRSQQRRHVTAAQLEIVAVAVATAVGAFVAIWQFLHWGYGSAAVAVFAAAAALVATLVARWMLLPKRARATITSDNDPPTRHGDDGGDGDGVESMAHVERLASIAAWPRLAH
jgi:hypothetical protein